MSINHVTVLDCDGDGCNEDLQFDGEFSWNEVRKDAHNFYGWTYNGDRDLCRECSRVPISKNRK